MALAGWTGQARHGTDWDDLNLRKEHGLWKFDIRYSAIANWINTAPGSIRMATTPATESIAVSRIKSGDNGRNEKRGTEMENALPSLPANLPQQPQAQHPTARVN